MLLCVAGGVAQIAETFFRDGINDMRLVVTKADGTTQEITMTLNIERELPSGPSNPGRDTYLSKAGNFEYLLTFRVMCMHLIINMSHFKDTP